MKKILFLTRKDINHPKSGGAEVVIHEYMKGLAYKGYEITQISPYFLGSLPNEIIDGITIKRIFTIHTIYFFFGFYYLVYLQGKYDIIIDHAGGIPLLSPLYAWRQKIIFFTHHVGTKERSEYFHQWIGIGGIGEIFRRIYNHLILGLYKKKATITVSEGTQQELMSLGFHRVHVLKNTTNRPISHQIQQKEKQLLVLGRIVPNKRIDHAIKIIYELGQQGYHYTLNIVGNIQDHIEYNKLQQLSKKLGIEQQVIFHSKIEQKQVTKLLDQSEYLLLTSKKEGFGIVVLEANTRGVPAIGYNIPGVNEAISNSKNGILITDGDCASIARYIIAHQDDYHILQKSTIQYITSYPTGASNINRMEKILLSS